MPTKNTSPASEVTLGWSSDEETPNESYTVIHSGPWCEYPDDPPQLHEYLDHANRQACELSWKRLQEIGDCMSQKTEPFGDFSRESVKLKVVIDFTKDGRFFMEVGNGRDGGAIRVGKMELK